jgi:hypothetical protein
MNHFPPRASGLFHRDHSEFLRIFVEIFESKGLSQMSTTWAINEKHFETCIFFAYFCGAVRLLFILT